jgi:hypothetical protein
MSAATNDPFLEKIKQYAADELSVSEGRAQGGGGAGGEGGEAAGPNSGQGAFSSLLLPHEWLLLDNSYVGAPPALPDEEYKSMLEVGICRYIYVVALLP